MDKLDFVIDQLSTYSEKKVINSTSCFVSCPFHAERTPSCRVYYSSNSNPGYFKCYGCGEKGGWDILAPKLGLKQYEWTKPVPMFARSILAATKEEGTEELELKDLPKNKLWRQIKTNLLIDIGAKLLFQYGTKFVYMPVTIRGKERGYIRARLKKEKDLPSYLNSKGNWGLENGLFPYDYSVKSAPKTVVLVEGPRDALRLLSYNIPAIAILGTHSWSNRKTRLLELAGIENIVIMMDGDCSGQQAEELIKPTLSKMFKVHVFNLRGRDSPYYQFRKHLEPSKTAKKTGVDLWDPGNCPLNKLKQLKEILNEINSKGSPRFTGLNRT
jgi:5S rRNA maturation endonuclease (ribonuclease M5)